MAQSDGTVGRSPRTYSANDVSKILKGRVTLSTLQRWDEQEFFRPSLYAVGEGRLIDRAERDTRLGEVGKTRGAPHRRYTYLDLVWMRLFLYVMDALSARKVSNAGRKAANIIANLRGTGETPPPHSSRLLFVDEDVFLLNGGTVARCLTASKQLPLTQIFTDQVAAEVGGRIQALVEHRSIESSADENALAEVVKIEANGG